MERLDLLGFLLITFNCNVTIVGKIWLLLMVLLRMLVLVWAGAPVYQDEQERFVCNTLQPGCANVCYDAFSPVSQLRLWLLQGLAALLPSALFGVYALHRGAELAARGLAGDPSGPRALRVPDLSCGYIAHLLLRVLAEAAFGALHYLLFGVAVPERFACARPPCSGPVHCFVSRPTEKALLARLMGAASVSAAKDAPAPREVRPTASALANLLAPGAIAKVSGLGKASCGTEAPARVSSARLTATSPVSLTSLPLTACHIARAPQCRRRNDKRGERGRQSMGLGGGLPPGLRLQV
nr:gap junction delta-4 protein [Vulpes vulpes]